MTDCPHCAVDDGIYNWGCDSCCARFLEHCPDRALRSAWLERWVNQFGAERTEAIKQLVAEAWADKVEKHKGAQ